MIPNIAVYAYHMQHEFHESEENAAKFPQQSAEQFGEGIFFLIVTIGYSITTILVLVKPTNLISYYAILIGTVIIIVIYYLSKTSGVWIYDGFDNWIIDNSTNWKDSVTKIAQQTFVIPLSMLLVLQLRNRESESD